MRCRWHCYVWGLRACDFSFCFAALSGFPEFVLTLPRVLLSSSRHSLISRRLLRLFLSLGSRSYSPFSSSFSSIAFSCVVLLQSAAFSRKCCGLERTPQIYDSQGGPPNFACLAVWSQGVYAQCGRFRSVSPFAQAEYPLLSVRLMGPNHWRYTLLTYGCLPLPCMYLYRPRAR
jgi:hypothetical protein